MFAMYTIFNRNDGTYTMPNGKTMTSEEIKTSGEFDLLFVKDCVISLDSDNIFQSYEPLAQMAERYGLSYSSESDDAEETLEKVLAAKAQQEALSARAIDYSQSVLKAVSFAALSFTDEQALEVPDLYPAYEVNHAYKKDERFTYNGRLFKVNQAHTSAAQWVPGETGTESLYTNLEMAGDGYLVWTQPTGAHNAYNTGDIVHYPTADDSLYKSLIDGNVWSPDAYPQGWEIYNEV